MICKDFKNETACFNATGCFWNRFSGFEGCYDNNCKVTTTTAAITDPCPTPYMCNPDSGTCDHIGMNYKICNALKNQM